MNDTLVVFDVFGVLKKKSCRCTPKLINCSVDGFELSVTGDIIYSTYYVMRSHVFCFSVHLFFVLLRKTIFIYNASCIF